MMMFVSMRAFLSLKQLRNKGQKHNDELWPAVRVVFREQVWFEDGHQSFHNRTLCPIFVYLPVEFRSRVLRAIELCRSCLKTCHCLSTNDPWNCRGISCENLRNLALQMSELNWSRVVWTFRSLSLICANPANNLVESSFRCWIFMTV